MYAPKEPFQPPPREPPRILDYRRKRKRRSGKMRKILLWIALVVFVLLIIGACVKYAVMQQPQMTARPQTVAADVIPFGDLALAATIKSPAPGSAFGSQAMLLTIYRQHKQLVQQQCFIVAGNQASEALTLKYQLRPGGIVLEEIDGCATLQQAVRNQYAQPIAVNGGIPAHAQNVRSLMICLAPSRSSSVTVSVTSVRSGLKVEGLGQHPCS